MNLFKQKDLYTGLEHSMKLFEQGTLKDILNPSLKCPLCKKKREFKALDLNCKEGYGYLEGEYARLYRCPKCHLIIGKKEIELKGGNLK